MTTESQASQVISIGNGRQIGFRVFGAPLGERTSVRTVFALHGTPGSRLKYAPADEAARARGLALIALDRWGYGLSTAHDGPLSDFGRDALQLADELGLARFSVVGISGGGPFATAIAALGADRVERLALVAPVGPCDKASLAGREMSSFHRFCFRVLPRVPCGSRSAFAGYRGLLRFVPHTAIAVAMARSGPADRQLLKRHDIIEGLAAMMREGLSRGLDGPVRDLAIFSRPWEVPLAQVSADARIWFGDQDGSVPEAAVVALAEVLPNATLSRVANQGHFWVATRFDEVLDWLAP